MSCFQDYSVFAQDKNYSRQFDASLRYDGYERTFIVRLPDNLNFDKLVPLLIVLHGGGGSGRKMIRFTEGKFNELSERENVLVVYPDAYERNWNDGRGIQRYPAMHHDVDDVGFLSALIDHLAGQFPVDKARVYVTGVSNGAMMTLRLACELSDKIAAVAPIIGALPRNLLASCRPKRSVPIVMVNGTADPLVPWEGGYVRFGRQKLGEILSVPDTVRFWAGRNGCSELPMITYEEDRAPGDATRVRKETYRACRGQADTVLYAVEGGGHTCPGRYQYLPEKIVGRTSRDFDAIEAVWAFLKRYHLGQ